MRCKSKHFGKQAVLFPVKICLPECPVSMVCCILWRHRANFPLSGGWVLLAHCLTADQCGKLMQGGGTWTFGAGWCFAMGPRCLRVRMKNKVSTLSEKKAMAQLPTDYLIWCRSCNWWEPPLCSLWKGFISKELKDQNESIQGVLKL